MGRQITVTFEDIERAAKQIESLASDYKTQYNAFYSETDAMATAWQGKDHMEYINAIAGFKDDFEKMYKLMESYVDFLRNAVTQYRNAQNHVTDQAKKLVN